LRSETAGTRPISEYASYLASHDLEAGVHDEALAAMVKNIQRKLLGVEVMRKLKNSISRASISRKPRPWHARQRMR
jgi:hypothetical protein